MFGAALAILGAWAMAPGPGFSQEVGLTRGEASLSSGQYEIAVQQLSATVNDGKSTVEQAAKATLVGEVFDDAGLPHRWMSRPLG